MEMRLGKTRVAIETIRKRNSKRILILCPKMVVGAWIKELNKYGEKNFRLGLFKNLSRQQLAETISRSDSPDRVFLVLNHEAIRVTPEIAFMPWDEVVYDESVTISNYDAQLTDACLQGFRDVKHRWIFTGNINPENKLQIFSQIVFCDDQFLGFSRAEYWQFRIKKFLKCPTGWTPRPGTIPEIKQYIYSECFVLSRKQVKLGPIKVYEQRLVEMPKDIRAMYKKAEKEFVFLSEEDGDKLETEWILVVQNWLMRLCSGFSPTERDAQKNIIKPSQLINNYKFKALEELLKIPDLKNEKIVIWCNFLLSIEELAKMLGKKCLTISGKDSQDARSDKLEIFATDKNVQYLVAQQSCAKYGVDCSVADTAIYFERSMSANTRIQSEDRIVHLSKTNPVLIIDLAVEDTIDEDSIEALKEKKLASKMLVTNFLEQMRRRNK